MTRSSSPRLSPKSPMASLFGSSSRDDGDSSTVSARSRSRSIDSPHPSPGVNALSSLTRRMAGEAKRMLGGHSEATLTKASLKRGAKKEKLAAARESFFCADVKDGTTQWTEEVAELQRVGNRSSGSSNSSGSSDKSSPWAAEHGNQTPSSAASSTPSSPKMEKVAYFAPRPEYPRAYSSMSAAPPPMKPLPDAPAASQHRLMGSWLHEPDYEAPAVSFKRRSSECTLDLIQRENLASCISTGLSGVAEQDEALAHLGELLMNASPTATLRERRAKPPMHLPLLASTFTVPPPTNRPRSKSLSSHRSPPPCPPPSTPLPALPFSAGLPPRIATSMSNGSRPPSPPRQREAMVLPPSASPMTWPSPLFDTESLADEDFFDCPVPATPASICSSNDLEGDAFYDSSMPATPANAISLLPISVAHEGSYPGTINELAISNDKPVLGLGLDQESPGELMSALGLVFGSETMPAPIKDGMLPTQPLVDVGSAVEYGFAM